MLMTEKTTTENNPVTDPTLELTQTLQRVQADFENYRKRTQNEFNQHYARGKATAFKEVLAFMDTLDAAVNQVKDAHHADLEKLRTQLLQLLAQNGISPLSTKGKPFDPFTSECIMQGSDPTQEEDMVLEEFQRGYTFHEDVLRPAKVKVNKIDSQTEEHSKKMQQGGKNE
jgi:molecular chaperone GrpE